MLRQRPDLVISGINHGANLGENVYYSVTVGAAREAVIHHVPGLAVSLCSKRVNSDFAPTARLSRRIMELMLREKLPDQVLLNVNVPESWLGSAKLTSQSKKITRTVLREVRLGDQQVRATLSHSSSESGHRRNGGAAIRRHHRTVVRG